MFVCSFVSYPLLFAAIYKSFLVEIAPQAQRYKFLIKTKLFQCIQVRFCCVSVASLCFLSPSYCFHPFSCSHLYRSHLVVCLGSL